MNDFTIVNLQDLTTATGLTVNDFLAVGQGSNALTKATIQQVGAFLGVSASVVVGDKDTEPTVPSFAFAEAGTYTEWGNVEIIGNLGILIFDGTNFSKTEINFVANGIVEEGNTQAVSGGEVYVNTPTFNDSNVNYVKEGFSKISDAESLPENYFTNVLGQVDNYYFSNEDFFVENSDTIHYLNVFSEKKGLINVSYVSELGVSIYNKDIVVNKGYNNLFLNKEMSLPEFNTKHFVFIKQQDELMLRFKILNTGIGNLQLLGNSISASEVQFDFSLFKPYVNQVNVIKSFDKIGLNPVNKDFTIQNLDFLPNQSSSLSAAYSISHSEHYINSTRRLSGIHIYCIYDGIVAIDFVKADGDLSTPKPATYLNDVSKNNFNVKRGWNYISEDKINIPFFDGNCYVCVRASANILGFNNNYNGETIIVNGNTEEAEFNNGIYSFYIDTYNFDLASKVNNGEKYIELPKGQVDLTQNIVLDGVHLKGKGSCCSLIKDLRTSYSNYLIELKNYSEISDLQISGSNNSLNRNSNFLNDLSSLRLLTGVGDDNALYISGFGCKINNVRIDKFGGRAIYVYGQTSRLQHSIINNIQLSNNFIGLEFSEYGEYCAISNLGVSDNVLGILITAGNTFISSSTFNDNRVGLYMNKAGNDSHGGFSVCNFNHSVVYSMVIDNISHGHSFVGCHVFEGDIYLVNSIGFNFTGGTIDAGIYIEGGKTQRISYTSFQNAYWNRSQGIHHNYNGVTSYMKMIGNFFMFETGENDGIINNE